MAKARRVWDRDVDLSYGLRHCGKLAKLVAKSGITALAVTIADVINKHYKDIPLSGYEKFLAGLCYAEFLTVDSNNYSAMRVAEYKRYQFCRNIKVVPYDLLVNVEKVLKGNF